MRSVGARGTPWRIAPRTVSIACASSRDLVDRVAAELLEHRIGEHERHHRFAHHAAAGTAQTSLRSIAAGDSARSSSRSTERSGFISVAIGFM